ncbi:type V toxin-antitoxin system endoribonuclease antitoxin GhoS [Enterobacter sp. RHBSTW-00994]|uniref:type V toxin-antitoxin system endoribonuclease antitoxin GhoS n=1 Tax=Enterobacteriaceae TaxID=543 RepID=UPI0015E93B64|nr:MULTISPECIES: type V toxin-antitoxin system endoribonuclease antitoxin GhoS [Enterobacteriaceae]MBM3070802.1 type V toxin-antitoxin system endoribonuclease antitoxin GhoS [Lelliottia sp. RWM.1]QLR42867.1 type V toxin-antitoxin system endoribonuclease antitoxin GhoS [Enterobacter sp. RHBSTW-00994]
MSSGDIIRYVIVVKFHEASLTELNEINNTLTRANFLLTLTDDEGTIHELGTLTFALISSLSKDEVKALASGLVESAIHRTAEIDVDTWENWQKQGQ